MAPTLSTPRLPPAAEPLSSWQHAVLAELRAIRAALEQRRPVTTLSRSDRAVLSRMLPAVVGVFGGETFTARDLVEDDRPAVRLVVQGYSAKRLGKLLARADGVTVDGLRLHRTGLEYGVSVWRIGACGPG